MEQGLYIYLAFIPDRKHPWSELGERYPIIQTHAISLGELILHGVALSPNREWQQDTIGM